MTSVEEKTLVPFTLTNIKLESDDLTLKLDQNVERSKLEEFKIKSIKGGRNSEGYPIHDSVRKIESSEERADDAQLPIVKPELGIISGLPYIDHFSLIRENLKTEPEEEGNENPLDDFDIGGVVNQKNVEESFQNSTINPQVPEISTLGHENEKFFKCNMCGMNFCSSSELKKHCLLHSDSGDKNKFYTCDVCSNFFTHAINLEKHMIRFHPDHCLFECNLCQNKYPTLDSLNKHQAIHSGEKPYKCEICDTEFTQSRYLTRHMKSHWNGKKYKCEICSTNFYTTNRFQEHMKTKHGTLTSFECDLCINSYPTVAELIYHKQISHTGVKTCEEICKIELNVADDIQVRKKPKFTYGVKRTNKN